MWDLDQAPHRQRETHARSQRRRLLHLHGLIYGDLDSTFEFALFRTLHLTVSQPISTVFLSFMIGPVMSRYVTRYHRL